MKRSFSFLDAASFRCLVGCTYVGLVSSICVLTGCAILIPGRSHINTIQRSELHPVVTECLSIKVREIDQPLRPNDRRTVDDFARQSIWQGLTESISSDGSRVFGGVELRCIMNFFHNDNRFSIRENPLLKEEKCFESREELGVLRCTDQIIVREEAIYDWNKYRDYTIEIILDFSDKGLEKASLSKALRRNDGSIVDPPSFLALTAPRR